MTDTTTDDTTSQAATVEWHAVDADDRWPARWTAHTASVHAHGRIYLIRITPGDHATYLAPGFYADIDGDIDPNSEFVLNPRAWANPAPGEWGVSAPYYNDYRNRRRPDEQFSIGREFRFAEMKDPVKDKLKRFELFERFGTFYPTIGAAVDAYLEDYEVDWKP